MAYCEYCESQIQGSTATCPNCGAPVPVRKAEEKVAPVTSETTSSDTTGSTGTGKAATTLAGAALGASLLSSLFRRRTAIHRPRPPMGGGMGNMGRYHGGPMDGMGGHRGGPMDGMGGHCGGPRGGGRGPGGPGGRR